jgi:hypothetical protein
VKSADIQAALREFAAKESFRGRGPLSVALVVTQHARAALPLNVDKLVTEGGGQVLGLGKGAVQAILSRHGVNRVLASEGGRTSRGSLGKMRAYVKFLNRLNAAGKIDLDAVERFWIQRVHEFFAAKPIKIKLDSSRGLRMIVRDIVDQAEVRQKTAPGVQYVGAVMQYLVGAKLDCALGVGQFIHSSSSTADAPTGRAADFLIGDVAIHVTTFPSEGLIQKCRANLDDDLRPIIVTHQQSIAMAEGFVRNANLADRIDIFEIEQFVALNLYEIGRFALEGRKVAVKDLVARYNQIVSEVDTDPSLKIEFRNS